MQTIPVDQTIMTDKNKDIKSSIPAFIKITKYVLYDIIRNKILLAYTLFLLLVSLSLFNLEDDPSKAVLSLMSIIMIIVPLVSMVFTTSYFYNAYEFTELLVAQPVRRRDILLGEFIGVAGSLALGFLIGVGLPVTIYETGNAGPILILSGTLLTLVFVSISILSSVLTRDKARGIGAALLIWFFFTILYDALILGVLYNFSDYPLEGPLLIITSFNPVDLGRIMIMLKLDISALMGYTGALYKSILGTQTGIFASVFLMLVWLISPLIIALRIFKRKNL